MNIQDPSKHPTSTQSPASLFCSPRTETQPLICAADKMIRMSMCMIMFSKMEKFHRENIQGTYHTPPLPASDWMPSPPKEDLPKSLPTIISCPLSKFWCNLTIWTMFLNKWPYTRQDSQTADSSYLPINHPSHSSQQPLCQGRWYEAESCWVHGMGWRSNLTRDSPGTQLCCSATVKPEMISGSNQTFTASIENTFYYTGFICTTII